MRETRWFTVVRRESMFRSLFRLVLQARNPPRSAARFPIWSHVTPHPINGSGFVNAVTVKVGAGTATHTHSLVVRSAGLFER